MFILKHEEVFSKDKPFNTGDLIPYLGKNFVVDQLFHHEELQKFIHRCSKILREGGFCIIVESVGGRGALCRLPQPNDEPSHRLKKVSLDDVGKREPKIRYRGQFYGPKSEQEQFLGALLEKPEMRYRGQACNPNSWQEQPLTKEMLLEKPEIKYRGQAYNPNSWQETKAEQNQTPDPKS